MEDDDFRRYCTGAEQAWKGLLTVAAGFALACMLCMWIGSMFDMEERTVTKTDTLWLEHRDTVPVAVRERTVRTVYVPVGRGVRGDDVGTGVVEGAKDGVGAEVVGSTGDSIALPITQKVYEDTLYTAWVSGYLPSLDSIAVRSREVTRTVTVTRTAGNGRRWHAGIVGGYGIGLESRRAEPFVGVGIQYTLW